jgi:hypothetical protein
LEQNKKRRWWQCCCHRLLRWNKKEEKCDSSFAVLQQNKQNKCLREGTYLKLPLWVPRGSHFKHFSSNTGRRSSSNNGSPTPIAIVAGTRALTVAGALAPKVPPLPLPLNCSQALAMEWEVRGER